MQAVSRALASLCAGVLCASAVCAGAAEPEPLYLPIPSGSLSSVLSAGSGEKTVTDISRFDMRSKPVTVGEFLRFVEQKPQWKRGAVPSVFANGSYLQHVDFAVHAPANDDLPITNVSWFAAQAFCESENARLPTWYEWEYVAAADGSHADARKNPAWLAKILGWYSQPANKRAQSVGGDANFYGIQNMHGLIWEWVDDFNALLVSADSRNQGDPDQLQYCGAGAISLQDRDNFAILMRVALLSSLGGADSTNSLGFRCARSPLQ